MRTAVCLAAVLVVLGWMLSEAPVARTSLDEPTVTVWRRTSEGWQRPEDWSEPPVVRRPNLHPLVVGSLQLLVSLAALVAFPDGPLAAHRDSSPGAYFRPRTK
ncbi:MAG: hypothetical protein GX621_13365 [Pirellulaceae bacterium]|nr:hypothetical protein [Pirellulaceae bacterium]